MFSKTAKGLQTYQLETGDSLRSSIHESWERSDVHCGGRANSKLDARKPSVYGVTTRVR